MSKKRKNINIEILEEIREPLQSKITQNNGFINQSINNTTTSFINHCIKPQIMFNKNRKGNNEGYVYGIPLLTAFKLIRIILPNTIYYIA